MEIAVRAFRFLLLPGFQFKVQTNKDENRFLKAFPKHYLCRSQQAYNKSTMKSDTNGNASLRLAEVQHVQSCNLEVCLTKSWFPNAADRLFTCSYRLPSCWFRTWPWTALFRTESFSKHFLLVHALLLLYYFFQNLHWGITYHEAPTHPFATVTNLLQNHPRWIQVKPQGKCKNMRKGSLILFQFKINLSSWFFTRYGNLVILQDKHK